MAKRPLTIAFRIPSAPSGRQNRMLWRRGISDAAISAATSAGVSYLPSDRLEVIVRLYLDASLMAASDVDNWAKHVLDALQGRGGGSKKLKSLTSLIPNDNQVHRLVIEKSKPPKQSRGLGHVVVRKIGSRRLTRA